MATGTRIELTTIDDPRSFHDEARFQAVCATCGKAGAFDAHHVVESQRCRREGYPRYSPDNSLRLCSGGPERCHERHTTVQQRVELRALRDENFAFAARWMGAGAAYEYLRRTYAGSDPRLDTLLEVR